MKASVLNFIAHVCMCIGTPYTPTHTRTHTIYAHVRVFIYKHDAMCDGNSNSLCYAELSILDWQQLPPIVAAF